LWQDHPAVEDFQEALGISWCLYLGSFILGGMDNSNLSFKRHPHLALSGWLQARWAPAPAKGDIGELLKVGIALLVTLSALAIPFLDMVASMLGLVDLPSFEGPGPAAPAAMTAGVTDVLSADSGKPDEVAEHPAP
jgi:hypothetical protein